MKARILIVTLIFFCLNASAKTNLNQKRSMIFNGGGFKTAMFLGMLKGAKDSNLAPDYIIGTCGGSIPAAIAHSINDYMAQLEFVRSRKFYKMLKSISLSEYSSVGKTLGLAKDFYAKYKMNGIIPDLFDNFLMNVPENIDLPEISSDFTPYSHSTIIVASKILYTKKDIEVERGDRKLFQQVLFTDEATTQKLIGLKAQASKVEGSSVLSEIELITNATLTEAARASISDPFYMEPAYFAGERYITGAIDLYPIEVAKRLASEVISVYPDRFDIIEEGAIYATFNFSHNERHKYVYSKEIDYLIDYTDFPSELKFTPKPDFLAWEIKSRLPISYEEYREVVRKQFNYGYRRMLESAKNKNSKSHIRNL